MTRVFFTKASTLIPLAAVGAALALSGCVAPNPYASQPQYAQPQYAQPQYAQPAYTQAPEPQPAYVQQPPAAYQPAPAYGYAQQYGVVTGIQPLNNAASPGGVAGGVVGAVVGGVLGNQIGRGHGRDVATVVGALGGAVAGNQIGQQMSGPAGYRVSVQLNDGSMRAFDMPNPGDLHPGDRVRIDGDQISRY
ncbi:glycine zipper 2TM domain-containing protein [Trinickia terrae]|uniref:Glycine zipper 2TM domain-containing protein n=1 Tax=Trinickia terrae TaxID=2571161 RepID=A0A4U1IFD6_9BURK|nr:glycine zipper 2TM domain-containing protein [Trinickia terrae]TKC92387.1 glycine zipper 2TM domain-containing protein [Trinickia terrae]